MFLSLCYVVLRQVLQLAVLRLRSNDFKDLEIVVLRQELATLHRRTHRPVVTWTDRLFLAAAIVPNGVGRVLEPTIRPTSRTTQLGATRMPRSPVTGV